jgi:putative transposase
LDSIAGRKVWHNFWDTTLTDPASYLARLHYVHANPVHHGIVKVAREYPFCSAHWFETHGESAFVRTVYSFKIDGVRVIEP